MFSHGEIPAYPALADAGDSADVRLFETASQADAAMLARNPPPAAAPGARPAPGRWRAGCRSAAKLAMSRHPYPSAAALLDDCAACAADQVIAGAGGPAWDAEGFAAAAGAARSALAAAHRRTWSRGRPGPGPRRTRPRSAWPARPARAGASADMRAQLAGLIYPGFISATGARRLPDLVRYLRGISRRLEKLPEDPRRDAERMAVRAPGDATPTSRCWPGCRSRGAAATDVRAVRWMIEELRVSLFAQTLGTSGPGIRAADPARA